MSIEGQTLAEEGTPAYVTRFDGVRVPATDYRVACVGARHTADVAGPVPTVPSEAYGRLASGRRSAGKQIHR